MCFTVRQLSFQRDRLRRSKGRAGLHCNLGYCHLTQYCPALAVSLIGWSEGQLCEGGRCTVASAVGLFCRGRLGPGWLVSQSRVVRIIDINKIRPECARARQSSVSNGEVSLIASSYIIFHNMCNMQIPRKGILILWNYRHKKFSELAWYYWKSFHTEIEINSGILNLDLTKLKSCTCTL